jgi:hypothetical protein
MLDLDGKKNFILLNIKSGEMLKLNYNNYICEQIVEVIFQDKYGEKREIGDEEFINMVNVLNKYK